MRAKVWRPLAAELIGTALFVFFGAGSVVMTLTPTGSVGPLTIALVHGLALAIIVSATMNISGGHINPAVTTGLWMAGKIDGRAATRYVVAQLVGALIGAALVKGLLPAAAVRVTLAGAPRLAATVTFGQGVLIEAVLTFFLMTAVFGTAVSPEAPKIGGFGIGLAVFVDAVVGGDLTGAAMNPARAFGPAVIAADMHGQAVYWIGPLLGAAAAAVLWRSVLLPRDPVAS